MVEKCLQNLLMAESEKHCQHKGGTGMSHSGVQHW